LPQTVEHQIFGINAPGLRNYLVAKARHESFDQLSGVSPSERQRDDLINQSIFQRLEEWLEKSPAEKLITLSHKFFAHAADMGSLGSIEYSGIRLADVAEVHQAIVRVERTITDELLCVAESREVVPIPPLGLFQMLEFPYVSAGSITSMDELWRQLSHERNSWRKGIADELTH